MREINFQEVGMENFGPYMDPMVLTFQNDTLTLITGPNGIGKTMSLEALPFTLYGETCKKARGDDVVNTRAGKNCHTWVKFRINTDEYVVHRYHKYKSLGNTVTIEKNGEEPYKKGHREVVPEIEKLICSKKSFTNTLMFGQKVKDFFTDLVDSDKKEIFRKILDLDIYTEWYKIADLDLKSIKEKIQKIMEQVGIERGILGNTEHQIEILLEQLKQFEVHKKDKIESCKKNLEENQRLIDGWEKDLNDLNVSEDELDKIQTQINDVEKQKQHHESEKETQLLKLKSSRDSKLSEMLDAANKAKEKVVIEYRKANEEVADSQNELVKMYTDSFNKMTSDMSANDSRLSAIETEKRILQQGIDKLNNSLNLDVGNCPTCLQVIDERCKLHIQEEVDKQLKQMENLIVEENYIGEKQLKISTQLEETKTSHKNSERQYKTLKQDMFNAENAKIKEIGDKLDVANKKVYELAESEAQKIAADYDDYINNLAVKLENLYSQKREASVIVEKYKEIQHTISNLKQARKGHEMQLQLAEESEYDKSQLAAYQIRKIELEKSIEEMKEGLVDLQAEEEISAFWKSAWSPTGIPSMLIDESIPFMNKKVSEYLDRLTNGRYIVSFDTLAETKAGEFRDKISVNVLDTYTRANSRIQLSGGQTRLVDIATILTLGDLQSSIQDVTINILLFDEIFDSLDEENIGFVSKILSQLKMGKCIYLISHTQVDQLEADEILEFK